jgi:large subunit ribosomal protein L17
LATSVFLYEKVTTTEAKAKAVLPMVERLITHAKSGSIAARRIAKATLFDPNAVAKLFEDVRDRRGTRESGFVRLTKLPVRPGDGASMASIELLYTPVEELLEKQTQTKVKVRTIKTEKVAEETK